MLIIIFRIRGEKRFYHRLSLQRDKQKRQTKEKLSPQTFTTERQTKEANKRKTFTTERTEKNHRAHRDKARNNSKFLPLRTQSSQRKR